MNDYNINNTFKIKCRAPKVSSNIQISYQLLYSCYHRSDFTTSLWFHFVIGSRFTYALCMYSVMYRPAIDTILIRWGQLVSASNMIANIGWWHFSVYSGRTPFVWLNPSTAINIRSCVQLVKQYVENGHDRKWARR